MPHIRYTNYMKKALALLVLLFNLLATGAFSQIETPEEKPLAVQFSSPGGFFEQPISLNLLADGAKIYFTTDGNRPTQKSQRFNGSAIFLEKTTVVRAMAVRGEWQSQIFTQTFFIGEPATNLPIVSVSIAPALLFDPERGLMKAGMNADVSVPNAPGANFWSRKEYGCNVEIFEMDKKQVHNSPAGFRIFGGYSRIFPQKSIVLVARKKYGKKFFKHKIFGKGDFKKHKYLVLRNGGSDCLGAHFRDELMTSLTAGWDIETQDFRPALLFLNGKYWGIYHIREKINGRFLQDHTDVDKDSLDLLEHRNTVRDGSARRYQKLLNFIENHDLADPENFARVRSEMDVSNFIDYQIAQIYCDNTDGGGNIRYWRAHRPEARWRWILFDTDWGFGLYNSKAWQHNTLDFALEPNGPDWPNPPWSTFLLRNLLKNDQFREMFATRMADRLNTDFSTENVLSKIGFFEKILLPEMPRHLARWQLSEKEWVNHLDILKEFAEKRPQFLQQVFAKTFDLGELAGLEILPSPGGSVWINRILQTKKGEVFEGQYFEKIPVRLQATPDFGFKFEGWEGVDADGRVIQLNLRGQQTLQIRPKFSPFEHPLHDQIFFNEICTYNKVTGDWAEIFNNSGQPIHLEGWSLTDSKNEYSFGNFTLAPDQYLVVCQDSAAFRSLFPQVKNVIGNLGFGFDRATERLAIFAADGSAVDSVRYRVEPLDEPFSIDLMFQNLDNANAANWNVRRGVGSPGEGNPLYLAQIISAKKDFWTRIGLAVALGLVVLLAVFYRIKR